MRSQLPWFAAMLVASSLFVSAVRANVLRVVVVQPSDLPGYVKQLELGQALQKKLGSQGTIRVWRARYAGDLTGRVVVTIEYPDLAAFAADDMKLSASPEYQAWLHGLDQYRKIISDSLYDGLTP